MENGLKGGGDMGEGRQRRVMGERGGSGAKGGGGGRKGRKRSERGRWWTKGGRGRLRAKGELHTAAVKNTVERRFKALDNLADAHILRGGWIYFEFLTERQ